MKLSIKKSGRFTYLYAVKGYRDDRIKAHFLTHGSSAWIGRLQDGYPDHHQTNDEEDNIIHQEKR